MVIHRKSISVKLKKRHENTNLKRGQIVSYALQSRLSLVSIVTLSNSVYTHLWSDVCKTLVKLSSPTAPEVLSSRSVDSEGLESVWKDVQHGGGGGRHDRLLGGQVGGRDES